MALCNFYSIHNSPMTAGEKRQKYQAIIDEMNSKIYEINKQYNGYEIYEELRNLKRRAVHAVYNLLKDGEKHSYAEIAKACDGFFSKASIYSMATTEYCLHETLEKYLKGKKNVFGTRTMPFLCCDWVNRTIRTAELDENDNIINITERQKEDAVYFISKFYLDEAEKEYDLRY